RNLVQQFPAHSFPLEAFLSAARREARPGNPSKLLIVHHGRMRSQSPWKSGTKPTASFGRTIQLHRHLRLRWQPRLGDLQDSKQWPRGLREELSAQQKLTLLSFCKYGESGSRLRMQDSQKALRDQRESANCLLRFLPPNCSAGRSGTNDPLGPDARFLS